MTVCDEKDQYRFGFNGMEKDNEAKGLGNSLDFGARIYDSRLGKFLSTDPWEAKYPSASTYAALNNSPMYFIDPTGKGGVAFLQTRENGEVYIRVVSKIYVYSNQLGADKVSAYASKIENDINYHWNNPVQIDGSGNITQEATATMFYGKNLPIVFDVQVEAVSPEEALSLAKRNQDAMDYSVNFMEIVDDGSGSQVTGTNSGRFDIRDLELNGNTTGAHEYGHLLGYFRKEALQQSNKEVRDDEFHADGLSEQKSIMARPLGSTHLDLSKRRVTTTDIKRINKGKGAANFYNGKQRIGSVPDNNVNVQTGSNFQR